MKRIYVAYGGIEYSMGNRDLDEVKAEVEHALTSGESHWLRVSRAEGAGLETDLLIARGINIALTGVDAE